MVCGLPRWLRGKEPPCREDLGSIPGLGRSPGEGNGNPLLYSHLENPTDRGVWWATVRGLLESDTTEHTHIHTFMVHSMLFRPPYLRATDNVQLSALMMN